MTATPTTRTGPVGIGIIGAGVISGTYIENLTSFADTKVVAIADKITEKALELLGELKAARTAAP